MRTDKPGLSGRLDWTRSTNRNGRTRRARRNALTPSGESLECRALLAVFTGFSHVRNIHTPSGVYSLQIDGPGVLKTSPAGKGTVDVKVLGTTSVSTLTITQVRPRFHVAGGLMSIRNLVIRSGEIGGIIAAPAELDGVMTPLVSSLGALEFGVLGPAAQIDVGGDVGSMSVGAVDLGPTGHVVIAGDLNGALALETPGQTTTGVTSIGTLAIDGGRFVIGRDSLSPITIGGDMSLSHNGLFSIGRDQTGTISVGGSLILDTGGQLMVGRNLTGLSVSGDVLVNPSGSGIVVGGDLSEMTVDGILRGQGSPTTIDVGVGLNLNGLSVLGGGTGQGGIQSANISVGKSIRGLIVPHGIFRSWITAGVSISGVIVGADGATAIYNSEIDAATSITGVTANGDVKSGFPTGDPTGYPTRIIAGKIRAPQAGSTPDQGNYISNGTIDQFQINGAFIDSVLAASVVPYGGDGSLPPPVLYGGTPRTSGPPPAGFSNYNAPGGLTGPDSNDQFIKNYSIRSIINGQLLPTAVYDTATDPNVHVNVLDGGTINAVVTGGVVSTPHGDDFDFTGVFAVNTKGINGGLAP
jgi:hypothetical protein